MIVENKAMKHKCNTPNVLYVLKTRQQRTHVRHVTTDMEEDAHFGSVII